MASMNAFMKWWARQRNEARRLTEQADDQRRANRVGHDTVPVSDGEFVNLFEGHPYPTKTPTPPTQDWTKG